MIDKLDKCLEYKLCVVAIVLVLGAVGAWLLHGSAPQSQQAAPSAILHSESVSTITAPVQVYAPAVKRKLSLPVAVQDNAKKVVLAATDLSKSKHDYTVTTVLDISTGESSQFVEVKPLKWLATASSGSAGIYAGLSNLDPTIRVQVTQDLFTVKAMTFGAVASVDIHNTAPSTTFIGIGGRLDW